MSREKYDKYIIENSYNIIIDFVGNKKSGKFLFFRKNNTNSGI